MCAWVKHPDIKKCTLKRPTPKATSLDVEASFGVSVGTRIEKLLTAEGLKSRLNFDVRAYFADQACGEVPDLVVPGDGQSAFAACQGVTAVERHSTGAMRRKVSRLPSIT